MTDSHLKGIVRLGEEWGSVYIRYYPDYDNPYTVSNVTDEGLPIERERIEVRGKTLDNAIAKALNEL